MKKQGSALVVKRFVMLGAALATFVSLWGVTAQAEDVSPVGNGGTSTSVMTTRRTNALGTADSAGNNNLYHVLKKETSSDVYDVDMFVYFNNPAATRYIEITDRNTNPPDRCQTHGPQAPAGSAPQVAGNYYIAVTIQMWRNNTVDTTVPNNTVTYRIPRDQVCGAYAAGTSNGGARPLNDSYFFARYPAPAGFGSATIDPNTNLYKLRVTIDLNSNVPEGDTSGPNRQQVMFKVRTDNNCAPAASCANNRYISAVPTGGRNTSTLGSDTGAQYKNQFHYFGLPCGVNTPQTRSLTVYDVDNLSEGSSWDVPERGPPGTGRARFKVQFNNNGTWTSLPVGSYTLQTVPPATSPGGSLVRYPTPTSDQMVLPNNAGLSVTRVSFTMQPRMQYRVQLGAIWTGNLVGYGLPEENIFGRISCNVNVTGRVTPNPATGPLIVGTGVTFSPFLTRTDRSAFASNVTYQLRTWYDVAGNSTYNSGTDQLVPGGNCQGTGSRTLASTASPPTDLALPTCSTTVDTSAAGGNASAICSLLTITPTDTLTSVTQPSVVCLSIGKRPHLFASNGDVFAGGVLSGVNCTVAVSPIISGSEVTVGTNKYSSWGTYGVTSLGAVRGFGSSNAKSGQIAPDARQLIFSNRTVVGPGPLGSVGGYFNNTNANTSGLPTQTRCLNEPFSTFSQGTTNGGAVASVDISTLVGAGGGTFRRFYNASGTFTVTASAPIPGGTKVVIDVRGASADVKIDSNITYANGPYGSIDQIPQVVILSDRDITIDDAVTRVDGVLGAQRDLITCELPAPTTEPRLGVCNSQLYVNGAVVAGGKVRPYRTWGGEVSPANGTGYETPAEIFNLAPNVLLKSLPGGGGSDVFIRTVTEKEAPPRF